MQLLDTIDVCEAAIQAELVVRLRKHGVKFTHVPNGGSRHAAEAAALKRAGLMPGVPDLLIFDPPPNFPPCHGAALEVKKLRGVLSDDQVIWLADLAQRGWYTGWACGMQGCLDWLHAAGYLPTADLGCSPYTPRVFPPRPVVADRL